MPGVFMFDPTHRRLALWTARLATLPVNRELLEPVGVRCACLPTRVWAGRASQGDAVVVTAFHQKLGADIGRIDKMLSWRQCLVDQGLLDVVRAPGFMDRRRGRMDVGEEMRLGGLAGLRDVDHVACPLCTALVAITRLDIVG